MKVFESINEKNNKYDDFVFMDIETTGLTHQNPIVSITVSDGVKIVTTVIEDLKDEQELISDFIEKYNGCNFITYNGESFDLPFIRQRAKYYNLDFEYESTDLYKYFNRYRHLFPMKSLRQMEVEKYFNLDRGEDISGAEVVELFRNYLSSKDEKNLDIIGHHNLKDVEGLVYLYENRFLIHRENRITFGEDYLEIRDIDLDHDTLKISGVTTFPDMFLNSKDYLLNIHDGEFALDIYTKSGKYSKNLICNYVLKRDFPVEVSDLKSPEEVVILNLKSIEMYNLKSVVSYICKDL